MCSPILSQTLNVTYFISILITPLLIIIIYYYYIYFKTKNRLKNVPKISPNIASNQEGIYNDLLIKYPKICGKSFWAMLGFEPILFSCDKDLIEAVLSSHKHTNKPNIIKFLKRIGKNGLIAANENTWRNHRKVLTPSFHYNLLESNYLKTFNIESNRFVDDLKEYLKDDSCELVSKAKLWSFRQALETLLGIKSSPKHNLTSIYMEKLEDLIKIISNRVINPLEYFDFTYYFTNNYRREKQLIRFMDKFALEIIEEKISTLHEESPKTTLNLMLKELVNKRWSLRDVFDEIYTTLFTSFETTALTLSYTIFNFANHPEMQEKAYNEIKNVLSPNINQELTSNLLKKLKYLDSFLKESMRIYTVTGVLPRKLGEEVKWGELTLPKGLTVVIPVQALHNDPQIYPEPCGPRSCIGAKYAMLALKTCLCKLLLNYKLVSIGHQLQRSVQVTIISKNGVKIKLEKRN
ncbi:cytochrome P450 4d8-like isoform X2 [Onthophagus taurus]|uniref:cytochrome P450 4d8-like isoform X2 n=1 Tax=Onthophagus taurus TaxID=166361 RepID=UPI0039BE7B47